MALGASAPSVAAGRRVRRRFGRRGSEPCESPLCRGRSGGLLRCRSRPSEKVRRSSAAFQAVRLHSVALTTPTPFRRAAPPPPPPPPGRPPPPKQRPGGGGGPKPQDNRRRRARRRRLGPAWPR